MSPVPTQQLAPLVLQAVAEILDNPDIPVRMDSRLRDDLGFDSVKFMQVKFRVEQLIPALGELALPEMITSLNTVETLAAYLGEQLQPVNS
jgi:acyl carrier protein